MNIKKEQPALSGISIQTLSEYTLKRDSTGKPLISKYRRKKLSGSAMGLAMLAALGGD